MTIRKDTFKKLFAFFMPPYVLNRKKKHKSVTHPIADKRRLSIIDNGQNNLIEIESPDIFTNTNIQIDANNTHIVIKNAKYIRFTSIFVYNGDNQKLVIGDDVSVEGMSVYLCGENSSLTIEDDCMIANNVQIWTADGHAVMDKDTQQILNKTPTHLVVGAHSWLAQDVKLLKKAQIPPNSIVGASSVVSKKFAQEFTVIAGNPAKVVKQNVTWHRDDPNQVKEG